MKSNLMSSRFGLTSARRSTVLPCGSQVILTVGAAAQLQQDQSVLQQGKPVQILVKAANWFAPVAFPAMRVPAIPAHCGRQLCSNDQAHRKRWTAWSATLEAPSGHNLTEREKAFRPRIRTRIRGLLVCPRHS